MSKSPRNEQAFSPVPLAIIGMGCLFPKADSTASFWANIKGGVDAVTDIPATHWKAGDYFDGDPSAPDMTYARRGAFLEPVDFNPLEFGITPNNVEATDTTQLLGMVVAQQALRDAGYATGKDSGDGRPFNRDKTSVILGVTGALELVIPLGARLGHPIWKKALKDAGVEGPVAEDVVKRIADSYVPWQENSFPGLLGNVAAGRIANRFDLGGTNCVVDAACASSLGALHMAAMELYAGRTEMAITGGIDTFNDIFMYMCFSKTPALSPTGNSKPFSAGGDGTILGEGLGVIVLKRLADAKRDGDNIRAVIRSIGSSSDGKGNAVYAPSAAGQVKCLLSAYEQAGVSPETIELVEGHGTGTKVGDAVEAKALDQVFSAEAGNGTRQPWCALGSVKSMVGHTKAAAGIAGLIKAALALDHKVLPPTIKVEKPLENLEAGKSALYVNTEKRPWVGTKAHPRRAGVSAFGFGGSNFHCVLEEGSAQKRGADWDDSVVMLPVSGESREAVAKGLSGIETGAGWTGVRKAGARLCKAFKSDAACRLVMVAQKGGEIGKLIESAKRMLSQQGDRETWSTPEGVYFSAAKVGTGTLGVLFPGQGSQYVGMLRDLACQFPEMLEALAGADEAFGCGAAGERLSDRIYPVPAFTEEARGASERALNETRVAQPALGAVSWGAWQVLRGFGVQADAVAGHSFGELVALAAGGRMEAGTLHRLAAARGAAMAEAAGNGEAGSMLAVMGPVATLEGLLTGQRLNLVIANKNSPEQAVLSGATADIERAAGLLEQHGLRVKRLAVSAAFHSALVAPAAKPFAAAVESVAISAGTAPVFANTTGATYPGDAREAGAMLGSQLAKPVEFVREIEAMYATGVRTFVEVGPGAKLTGLVKAILKGRAFEVVALDASNGKRAGVYDLGCLLGQLASLGYGVELCKWDAAFAGRVETADAKKPAMTIRLSGANYVKPRPATPPRAPVAVAGAAVASPVASVPEAKTSKPLASPAPVTAFVERPYKGQPALNQNSSSSSGHHSNGGGAPAALTHAIQATQQGILALQKMQEQTAQLHQQYLQGQELAQRSISQLIEQQMQLLSGGVVMPAMAAPVTRAPVIAAPVVARQVAPARQAVNGAVHRAAPVAKPVAAPVVKVAAVAPAAVVKAAPVPVAAPANDRMQTVLLEVVADKTGYPVEMLELDMSLDTDLGIDSIKRVEILSALQTRLPEAPVVKPEDLGRLQTLRQIVAFLGAGQGKVAVAEPVKAPAARPSVAAVGDDRVQGVLLEVVADKTGYPVEMLELDMSLDTDLGIDSIKRVEILSALQTRLPEAPVVKPEDLGRLQTLRQIVAFLQDGGVAAPAKVLKEEEAPKGEAVPAQGANGHGSYEPVLLRHVLTVVPLDGGADRPKLPLKAGATVWVTEDGAGVAGRVCAALKARGFVASVVGLDAQPAEGLAGLLVLAPAHPEAGFIQSAFGLIQRAGLALRTAGRAGGAFLASASSMDGCFALNGHTPKHPVTGGLAGLVKTAGHEWPEVACKSLDLSHDSAAGEELAGHIVEELLVKGPVEVGISPRGRCETKLVQKSLNGEVGKNSLGASDVVVVTGGARGVTAAVSLALAKAYQCKLLLIGRSAAPTAEPAWLAGLTDEAAIKKAIAAQLKEAGAGANPRAVEEAYRRAMGNREVLATLGQIEAAGATVMYRSLDVRDAAAVGAAIEDARRAFGPIRGVIHGAGVLQDRLIEQKTSEQFDAVYSTKVGGFTALLEAVKTDPLKVIVAFSSSTGRFGRKGQVAYAAANEVLNKLAQEQAHERPGCRVLSMNWGPWEGGMVTPQLARVFENEGIGLIPLQAGAEYLVKEMSTPAGGPVEIVILGPEPEGAKASSSTAAVKADAGMVVAFEREVSVETHPFLKSHVLKGRAVLPAAMMVEWLAHGAMHENPGMAFAGFDDLRIFKGVTLHGKETLALQVLAGRPAMRDGMDVVPVELRSGNVLHARASILLGSQLAAGIKAAQGPLTDQVYAADIYGNGRLFHGPALHGIASVAGWSDEGIVGEALAAPSPANWMRQPLRSGWIADPLAIDAAFQLMILWCFEAHGVGSLPTSASSYRQFARSFPQAGTRIQVRVVHASEHSAEATIEFVDKAGNLVARMDGYECVMDRTLKSAFATNELA